MLAAWCQSKGVTMLALIAVIAGIVAGAVILIYCRRIDRDGIASDPVSATGLGRRGGVRPLLLPHTGDNYLMKEMGFRIARKHTDRLRSLALWLGCIAPGAMALVAGYWAEAGAESPAAVALTLAAFHNAVGTLSQRWLFFAEARHTVIHYYRENPGN
jgi:DMSO reductase anchor subunit